MMEFHGVSNFNRALLIDWILQVFQAFNKGNSPSGFFTAVGLVDNFLIAKYRQKKSIGVDRLFLLGIASVLLTSKFEEIKPIRTQILLEKAGHGKFTHSQILEMERDIL
jgi:cyclin B/cyclin A